MSFTPQAREMQAVEQGGDIFTYPANWVDIVQSSSAGAVSYNLTSLRTALEAASSVPGQAGWAEMPLFLIFSADGPFWANFNGTAAIPSGNVTNGTGSEFTPNQRYCASDITAISFISASNVNISIQVYKP